MASTIAAELAAPMAAWAKARTSSLLTYALEGSAVRLLVDEASVI
jgi:hypothetical protein